MKIRDLKQTDFPAVLKMYDESYDEVADDPNFGDTLRLQRPGKVQGKNWAKKTYEEMQAGNILFKVAESDKKLVGFCIVRKHDVPDSELSHVGILTVRVRKGWRGQGIGTALIRDMLGGPARRKFEIAELSVISINKRAIDLYKKLGFKIWGTAPEFVKRGKQHYDFIHMYKKLR